jgi:acyl dehydratase
MTMLPLTFGPITPRILLEYAAASLDANPIHLDDEAARSAGFDTTITHGMLTMAVMARAITDWAGAGSLLNLSARFTAPMPVNATVTIYGRPTRVEVRNGQKIACLTLSAVADDNIVVVTGAADVLIRQVRLRGSNQFSIFN